MDDLAHALKNLPLQIETLLTRCWQTFNRLDIDPGIFYSLGAGIFLGVCALIYLCFNPGDPHSGWDITTDEDRFYALKKEIEMETSEERELRLAKEGKNNKLTVEEELKEMKKETLRQRKSMSVKKNVVATGPTEDEVAYLEDEERRAAIDNSTLMEDEKPTKDAETLRAEEIAKSFEGLTDVEIEAKLEVQALKKQFGDISKLRKLIKGKKYADAKQSKGCLYWTVRLVNYAIPIGLLIAAVYALNIQKSRKLTPTGSDTHGSTRQNKTWSYKQWITHSITTFLHTIFVTNCQLFPFWLIDTKCIEHCAKFFTIFSTINILCAGT